MGGALIRRGAYMGGGANSGIRQFGICVPWYNSIALMKKKIIRNGIMGQLCNSCKSSKSSLAYWSSFD